MKNSIDKLDKIDLPSDPTQSVHAGSRTLTPRVKCQYAFPFGDEIFRTGTKSGYSDHAIPKRRITSPLKRPEIILGRISENSWTPRIKYQRLLMQNGNMTGLRSSRGMEVGMWWLGMLKHQRREQGSSIYLNQCQTIGVELLIHAIGSP